MHKTIYSFIISAQGANPDMNLPPTQGGKVRSIRRFLPLVLLTFTTVEPLFAAQVIPGIDVLRESGFPSLSGQRVGLLTNHTGLDRSGVSSIDVLMAATECRLVALFAPEHGIRGELDQSEIAGGKDERTGLPVHSLYGKTRKPTPEMLTGIDVLVFDIQDIGCRFYTYIGTLSLAMEAARQSGIRVLVLDRPNPIGGVKVGGAIPPSDLCGGITCIHPLPTRHGMTVGELALLFNRAFGIGCDLEVLPMKGWHRSLAYDRTGLLWVPPSPNMKTLLGAQLYPGLGICEATNLSCARGTDRPFECYGAPFLDIGRIRTSLAGRETPGLRFVPFPFVPTVPGHPYRGERCEGLFAVVDDVENLDPFLAGLHLIQSIWEAHPDSYRCEKNFATLSGDPDLWNQLTVQRRSPEEIVRGWDLELESFRALREEYLLYPDRP